MMKYELPTNETKIPLAQVPNLPTMPSQKNGKKLHRSAAYRWAKNGLGTKRIRLRTVQVGGRKCTTMTLLNEFFAALAEANAQPSQPSKRQNRNLLNKVDDVLKREGF